MDDGSREREANFCALLLTAKPQRVLSLTYGLDTSALTDAMARWLVMEVVKRIGTGYRYADLRPYANEQQRAYLDGLRKRYVSDQTGEALRDEITAAHRQSELRLVLARATARADAGEDVSGEVMAELARLTTPAAANRVHTAAEMFGAAVERVRALRGNKMRACLPLGLEAAEKALAIQPGQLVVLGGKTGSGKTAFALNITWHTAFNVLHPIPVLYLNSEMGQAEMGLRLAAISMDRNIGRLRVAPNPEDEAELEQLRQEQGGAPALVTDPLGELTAKDVIALTRYHVAHSGTEVLVVDYVQRLRDWVGRRDMSQWQTMMEITAQLKTLATDLGIVVFCLAQMNSQGELAASKGMANDADLVLALERCAEDSEDARDGPPKRFGGQTHLLSVMKGRHIPSDLEFALRMEPHSLRCLEVTA